MLEQIPKNWRDALAADLGRFDGLWAKVAAARAAGEVYPPEGETFAALRLTPPEDVRVVILGQDPYHEAGQANGLAFSVGVGVKKLPPSLKNIFRELSDDLGVPAPRSGDLTPWAEQGVLLLNTVLTVPRGAADGHKSYGWQDFTDAVVAVCAAKKAPVAFVLWGAQAQKRVFPAPDPAPRLVLRAPHPSPLSSYRGFFGSRPFSKINTFLGENGEKTVNWQL